MNRKASPSTIQLIPRVLAPKSHDLSHEKRCFTRRPTIDFSTIHEANDAVRLFREMVTMSPQPSARVYSKLLSVINKMEEYSVALYVFGEMRQLGVAVSNYTMDIAINCCCHLKRVDFAFAILGSLLKHGYEPGVTTLNTLLKGLYLVGEVSEAETLFRKVLTLKLCKPDNVMILTVINGLCKTGHALTAHDWLQALEETSYKPDIRSYTAVTDGFCSDGMVDDALKFLFRMTGKGIMPDVVTYNSIIQGLCNFDRWNEVKYILLVEMVDHKVPLNLVTFNILVDAFCKKGMVKESEDIFKLMEQINVCPDIVTYNALINGYILLAQIEKAKDVFDSIAKRGLKPSFFTYSHLINGYCKNGNVDEALRLFHEIPRMGLKHTTFSYNTMIHGFSNEGRFDEAFSFLSVMEEKGVNPNTITYASLIDGLSKAGKLDVARNLFNQLPSKGLRPNVQIYTSLISSFYQEGLEEEAKCLLVEMEKNGCAPDNVTYNVIIQSLLKRNELYKTIAILEEMCKKGFSPHSANASMIRDKLQAESKDGDLLEILAKFVPKLKNG